MNDLSSQSPLLSLHRPRLAILVDGDNIPHSTLAGIEAKAQTLGAPVIRRVFADVTLRKDWAEETGYLTTHCTTKAGKNRADIHLVIAAMDIAHRGLATDFLICSDDRDFGPLVAHLQEQGLRVNWLGKQKPVAVTSEPALLAKPKSLSELDQRLHALLRAAKDGLRLQAIGSQMKNGTVKAQTGKTTWRAYLTSKKEMYKLNGPRQETMVSLV